MFTITLCVYDEELLACNRTYETSDAFVKEKVLLKHASVLIVVGSAKNFHDG